MPSPEAVAVLAPQLGGLQHPDGHPRTLALFATTGKPPQLVEQIKTGAEAVAEAVVHTLELGGLSVVRTDQIAPMHAAYTTAVNTGPVWAKVRCRQCGQDLFELEVSDPNRIEIHPSLIDALPTVRCDCP